MPTAEWWLVARADLVLRRTQRWFQGAITASCARPKRASPSSAEVDARITRSTKLTAAERLDIYAVAYFSRLHEALASDYPATVHLLGHERYHRVAGEYLTRFPSRHYSLNHLGRDFPRFLAGKTSIPRRALVRDVAKLELAMQVVFDAAEAEGLTPGELAAIPPERFPTAVFRFVPAFTLLELDHRANAIVSAVKQGTTPFPSPGRKKTFVAVYRKNYVLWRKDLDETEYTILRALRRGTTLDRALRSVERIDRRPDLVARVSRIFQDWQSEGVIAGLE